MPKTEPFDERFEMFNTAYVYIAGKHEIENSCRNFTDGGIAQLPPPKEVIQVEKRADVIVPKIITFIDELDKVEPIPKVSVLFESKGKEVSVFASGCSLIAVCWDGTVLEKKYPHIDDIGILSINGLRKLAKGFYEEIIFFKGEENHGESTEQ